LPDRPPSASKYLKEKKKKHRADCKKQDGKHSVGVSALDEEQLPITFNNCHFHYEPTTNQGKHEEMVSSKLSLNSIESIPRIRVV
jgi:hypothetical protein